MTQVHQILSSYVSGYDESSSSDESGCLEKSVPDDEEIDEEDDETDKQDDEIDKEANDGKDDSDDELCSPKTIGTTTKNLINKKMKGASSGHKASHKKMKLNHGDNDHKTKIVLSGDIKVHECDVCFKVFGSGQALGGHKRSHVNVGKPKINLIDLNLPAPIDEEYNDDDAGSQFEASVVSDGEFDN
uniref:C2H2-type domain-containing protein n=1 Tax=Tanacetum cinerariifolium TaxID=118510 RepID=A0A6L2MRR0_TANCI|nr:hypothetical protein [Tanacetum cinerariifolium]